MFIPWSSLAHSDRVLIQTTYEKGWRSSSLCFLIFFWGTQKVPHHIDDQVEIVENCMFCRFSPFGIPFAYNCLWSCIWTKILLLDKKFKKDFLTSYCIGARFYHVHTKRVEAVGSPCHKKMKKFLDSSSNDVRFF